MEILANNDIRPADKSELVFRCSYWGALAGHLLFMAGLIGALALFVSTFLMPDISGFHWSRIVLLLFILMIWGVSRVTYRVYAALRGPGNWLARIGPGGLLIKYRSYLHDDLPDADPIAVRFAWDEIERAELQKEILTSDSLGERTDIQRTFLNIKLRCRAGDIAKLQVALAFENQRKPANAGIDELKHGLFVARKNRAPKSEIARLKRAIQAEQRRYPGEHSTGRFLHRPVTMLDPGTLKVEWSQVTPGRKTLRRCLARYTALLTAETQHLDAKEPMTDDEFAALLAVLVNRDERIEAMKLVRRHLGCDRAEAKSYIEKSLQVQPSRGG